MAERVMSVAPARTGGSLDNADPLRKRRTPDAARARHAAEFKGYFKPVAELEVHGKVQRLRSRAEPAISRLARPREARHSSCAARNRSAGVFLVLWGAAEVRHTSIRCDEAIPRRCGRPPRAAQIAPQQASILTQPGDGGETVLGSRRAMVLATRSPPRCVVV